MSRSLYGGKMSGPLSGRMSLAVASSLTLREGVGGWWNEYFTTNGIAFEFDQRRAAIRDASTPANNFAGDPSSLLTYTSPSTKWVWNSSGVLGQSSGQLPYDCDPATNAALGVLVETAFTAYAAVSEAFDSWTADNSGATSPVVTANYANGPNGETTADRVVFNKTGGLFSRVQPATLSGVGTAGQPAVFSVWGRTVGGGSSNVGLRVASTGANKVFDGSLARHWLTIADGTTSPISQVLLFDSIVGNDETADVVLWGANVGRGTFPTSYVPVPTASPVTRNADRISLPVASFPWAAGGNVVTLSGRTALGSGTQVFFQADDGSENNRVRIERNSSNEIHCIVTNGGVEQCNLNLGSVANETDFAVSFGFQQDDFAASLNGGTSVTDVSGTLPTVTTLRVGSSFTGEQCCGWLRFLSVVPA